MRARDSITNGIGLLAMAVAIFAVGGALRWAQAVVAILVALAVLPLLSSRRVFERRSPLTVLIGVAAGLTAVSLIPLPSGLIELINPTGHGLREDGAELLGTSPWQALTLDAPNTLRALVFLLTLLGIALIALRVAVSERGRYKLMAAIGVLAGVTAAIVWVQRLLGVRALYGVYAPVHVDAHLLGPLLNLNHLACLMAIGSVVGIGLAAYSRQAAWLRVLWIAVAAGCGSITVASVSRGGTLALMAGAFVTCAALVGQRLTASGLSPDGTRRRAGSFVTSSLPIGVVAACAVVLVVYSSAGDVGRKFASTSVDEIGYSKSKFAAWKSAVTLVEESPWFGVGRGGFEPSFTRVHPASGTLTFSHAENEYLQAVIDWGVPGALALAGIGLWLAVVCLRRWRDGPLAAAALGGLAAVAVQSNVDFGMELLGLAVPVTVLAAAVAYVPLREAQGAAIAKARGSRIALIVALLGGATLLFTSWTLSIDEDHSRMQASDAGFGDIRDSIERHPLDYFGYARGAEALLRRGDRRAIRLLNHALRLHPTHPGLHRVAARILYREGFLEQATFEYAAAMRAGGRIDRLIREVVALFPVEIAAKAIPADLNEIEAVVATLDEIYRRDVITAWLTRVLELRPNNMRACDLLYRRVVDAGDLRAIDLTSRRCANLAPDMQTRLSLAALMLREKKFEDAIRLLNDVEQWVGRIDDKTTGWLALCDAHIGRGNMEDAKRCLRRLDASGTVTRERVGEIINRLDEIDRRVRQELRDALPGDAGVADAPAAGVNP